VTVAPGIEEGLVDRTLAADGQRTREMLLSYLPEGGPRAELYDLVTDHLARPGKGIRPALCLATCRAYGGHTDDALGAAAAIELLHNAFLVHDDICDSALQRRGRPAMHVRHGVPLALNAGDALAWLSIGPLLDNVGTLGTRLALAVLAEFHHLIQRTIEGQAVELGWRDRSFTELELDDYLKVVVDKTCWYSAIHPCRVGALIGSRGRADLDAIARFGFFLGAVFQIRDDVENVTDRTDAHGKDFGSDIIEAKPTLLLIHLLRTAPPDAVEEVVGLIGSGRNGHGPGRDERISRVVALMEECGSIDYVCDFADGLAGAALAEFEVAMGSIPESPDKAFLRSLVLHLRDPIIRGR
jgi:geranylgeranyl diphosphate synthase type II